MVKHARYVSQTRPICPREQPAKRLTAHASTTAHVRAIVLCQRDTREHMHRQSATLVCLRRCGRQSPRRCLARPWRPLACVRRAPAFALAPRLPVSPTCRLLVGGRWRPVSPPSRCPQRCSVACTHRPCRACRTPAARLPPPPLDPSLPRLRAVRRRPALPSTSPPPTVCFGRRPRSVSPISSRIDASSCVHDVCCEEIPKNERFLYPVSPNRSLFVNVP